MLTSLRLVLNRGLGLHLGRQLVRRLLVLALPATCGEGDGCGRSASRAHCMERRESRRRGRAAAAHGVPHIAPHLWREPGLPDQLLHLLARRVVRLLELLRPLCGA